MGGVLPLDTESVVVKILPLDAALVERVLLLDALVGGVLSLDTLPLVGGVLPLDTLLWGETLPLVALMGGALPLVEGTALK